MYLKPHVTEKTLKEGAAARYTFIVPKSANKNQIAHAVSALYGVTVKSVRTTSIPSKSRRVGISAKRNISEPQKKATVSLVEGQKIDIYEVSKEEPKKEKKENK